jgi:hypothetical protein
MSLILQFDGACSVQGYFEWSEDVPSLLNTIQFADDVWKTLEMIKEGGVYIGQTTALIPEASDAAVSGAPVKDGQSGDTDFPHGNLKTLATMGEVSRCPNSYGKTLVGVPDGVGAYLADDATVRVLFQSESYGPLEYES